MGDDPKETAKYKRRGARSLCTKLSNSLEEFIHANRPRKQVIEALESYKIQYAKTLSHHEAYCLLLTDAEFEGEEVWLDEVVSRANNVLSLATDFLDKDVLNGASNETETQTTQPTRGSDIIPNPVDDSGNGNVANNVDAPPVSKLSLKQEKLTVIQFDGSDILDYFDFRDDFKYAVSSKYSVQDARYILDRFVKGRAKEWIQGERDLVECWKTLDNVYGDPRLVSDNLTKRIQKFPNLTENDPKFEQLFHLLKRARSILSRLQRSQDLDNSTMMSTIERKLTSADRIKWAEKQKHCGIESTLSGLLEWVQDQLWVRQVAGVEKPKLVGNLMDGMENSGTENGDNPGIGGGGSGGHSGSSGGGSGLGYSGSGGDTPRDNGGSDGLSMNLNGQAGSGRCWYCKNTGHWIQYCDAFKQLSPKDRLEKVRGVRACYSCLRLHGRGKCYNRNICPVKDCRFTHHSLLHGAPFQIDPSSENGKQEPEVDNLLNANLVSNCKSEQNLLPIISIKCENIDDIQISDIGNILFDTGSQLTLVQEDFVQRLGLKGEAKPLQITKVGGQEEVIPSKVYTIQLVSTNGEKFTVRASSVPKIADIVESLPLDEYAEKFGVQKGELVRESGPLHLLIGIDQPQFHTGNITLTGELAMRQSVLGKVVFGRGFTGDDEIGNGIVGIQDVTVAQPVDLSVFWETEQMGVALNPCCTKPTSRKKLTTDEKSEEERIRDSAKKVGNQWMIQYPWARDPKELPDNYSQAYAKLCSTERRLAKNSEAASQYDAQVKDLLNRDCARKLSSEEIANYQGPVHYNSHHMVSRTDKESTPNRLVFNPAEKYQGVALNDFLIKGPDLLNSIVGVLLKFRENEVGYLGDVQKMYHQVLVDPEVDAHTHRFLWRNFENREPDVYIIKVLSFGDKPAPSMAAVAMDLTAEEMANVHPEASKVIIESRYMDDIVDSRRTVAEVNDLTQQIEEILETGHFKIKKWESNRVLGGQSEGPEKASKVLGIAWEKQLDTLTIAIKQPKFCRSGEGDEWKIDNDVSITKRMVLGVIAGIYDVFGLVGPVTMAGKMGLQELWKGKYEWDEPLPAHLRTFWIEWITDLRNLSELRYPRCLTPSLADLDKKPILVIFSDASEKAFGAVAYWRWPLINGEFGCRLIMSKGKVSPMKSKLTIPKLELQAMVIGSRIKNTITGQIRHEIEKTVMFTDSQVALAWVRNERREYKEFVSIRVTEIKNRHSESEGLRYCRSEVNCADELSRGLKSTELDGRWMTGPEYLRLPEDKWPDMRVPLLSANEKQTVEKEVKKGPFVGYISKEKDSYVWDELAKYSCLDKAIRVTGWIYRALSNFRGAKNQRKFLSPEEITSAERALIKHVQNSAKKSIDNYTTLSPFLDEDGIIRVGGRAGNSPMGYETNHPILIPSGWFGKLAIRKAHKFGHLGVQATVAKTRRRYWVIQAAKTAQSVRHQCVFCRELDAKTELQQMAPLPETRLKPHTPPFHVTACDLFGPYTVKYSKYKTTKVWGVLFTCMNVRAVYIDIASDYSTEGFLMTLRRFFAIHGQPNILYSDRGSNLVGAGRELRDAVQGWDTEKLQEYCNSRGTNWRFVTPTAAHHNGCAESLIRTTKRTLKQCVGKQTLWPHELQTILFEVANLVNQRPIGILPSEPNDGKCLTPNDMILGRASSEIAQGPFEDTKNEQQRYRFVQSIVNSWWQRWYRDVFPLLIPRRKWHTLSRNVAVGDYVLVKDPNPIRGKYTRGRVVEVLPGRDNKVRNVKVKTATGVTYERPVTKLVVLYPVEGFDEQFS